MNLSYFVKHIMTGGRECVR